MCRQAVNRLAVSKATQHSKGINSPYEACLFIRIATTLIRENGVEQFSFPSFLPFSYDYYYYYYYYSLLLFFQ